MSTKIYLLPDYKPLVGSVKLNFITSPSYLLKIEAAANFQITLDCCSHQGVQIIRPNGQAIPYCSRYIDQNNRYLNFLNLPFDKLVNEKCWIFAPRAQVTAFVQYYLSHPVRPAAMFIILQHAERPSILELLTKTAISHRIHTGDRMLRKPVANRQAFTPYAFPGRLHAILLPARTRADQLKKRNHKNYFNVNYVPPSE